MSALAIFFILLSILCSTVRNLFSKKLSDAPFGSRSFFLLQAFLFLAGGVLLLAFSLGSGNFISPLTFAYAICYGLLLISAQWLYTMAMKLGNVGICSTIYYFGFVIPTLAGVLFWKDTLKITGGIGIILVLVSILLSGLGAKTEQKSGENKTYLLPIILAMIASGGLGLMQKIQQISPYPNESFAFVAVAFLFAGTISLVASCFATKEKGNSVGSSIPFAILAGLAFSGSNLLNTTLAGIVPLSTFSPILNVGTIIVSTIIATVMFREKLSKLDLAVLVLGILAILLIGL